jgi:hypothetical protein
MRLVVADGPQDPWVHLEPETPEEIMALEACGARENGRTGAVWKRSSRSRSWPDGWAGLPGQVSGAPADGVNAVVSAGHVVERGKSEGNEAPLIAFAVGR